MVHTDYPFSIGLLKEKGCDVKVYGNPGGGTLVGSLEAVKDAQKLDYSRLGLAGVCSSRTSATTTSWAFSHACIFIGMPAMSGCVALTSIELGWNKLTAEGLEPFCTNPPPNLIKLEINSCGLQGTYCIGQPVRLFG
jgi:hypothetical protein